MNKNKNEVDIIFAEEYLKYDFGFGHPFWPERTVEFFDILEKANVEYKVSKPSRPSEADVLLAHSKQYIDRVKSLAKNGGGLSPDTPLNEDLLAAAYCSVGGSILALEHALKSGKAINLLGGMHHAGTNDSSGFCVFNDHSVAIRKLQKEGKINKAIIYDLDAHAGHGTQDIFYYDPSVFTVSVHQDPATIYPGTGFGYQRGAGAGEGYNLNLSLPPAAGERDYFKALDTVSSKTKNFKADMVVLVLGTDTFKKDPLSDMQLESDTYREIGKRFSSFPNIAVVFAGGYSKDVPCLWLSFLEGFWGDSIMQASFEEVCSAVIG